MISMIERTRAKKSHAHSRTDKTINYKINKAFNLCFEEQRIEQITISK